MKKIIFLALFLALASNSFARDPAQVRAFRKTNACPATHKFTGACAGWVVDHKTPLCAGGLDAPSNMQWQELTVSHLKDKEEVHYCTCLKHKPADQCSFNWPPKP